MRYDYSNIVPDTKDAIAPRIGVAYAASDRMVFRGGIGKFYEPARNQFMYDVLGNSVISTGLFVRYRERSVVAAWRAAGASSA